MNEYFRRYRPKHSNERPDNLENIIKGGFDSLNKNPESRILSKDFIPFTPPSLDIEYAEMRRLAAEEDDFRWVLDMFQVISERESLTSAETQNVLREAFAIYTSTQVSLAGAFAEISFDDVDQHLRNAHQKWKINTASWHSIELTPSIDQELITKIMDRAIKNTPAQVFLERVKSYASQGDVKQTQRYIGVSSRALELQGLVQKPNPNTAWAGKLNQRERAFFAINQELNGELKRAYQVAVKNKLAQAIGHAVSTDYLSSTEIKSKGKEIEDLILAQVAHMVRPDKRGAAYGEAIDCVNMIRAEIIPELLGIVQDPKHPLRQIFKPTRDPKPYSHVRGYERIEVPTRALVPRAFYESLVHETGMPIRIHPFFAGVALRYAHSG